MDLKIGVVLAALFWAAVASAETRTGRLFFDQLTDSGAACTTASSGTAGTCQTAADCSDMGGTADGGCTSGFGVCCDTSDAPSTCGATISTNDYMINTPDDLTSSTECVFHIEKQSDNICQFRLDFDTFELADPASVAAAGFGRCSDESLQVVSGSGIAAPTICGYATGQHMYIEADANPADLTFTGPFTANTDFSIKVSQIACDSPDRAPEGCLQYFTEETGTIESFNFDGEHMLENQDYTICIKNAEGMCQVQYSEDPTETEAFLISTRDWPASAFTAANAGGIGQAGPLQGDNCAQEGYISIVNGYTTSSINVGPVEINVETTTAAATTTALPTTTTAAPTTTTVATTTTTASTISPSPRSDLGDYGVKVHTSTEQTVDLKMRERGDDIEADTASDDDDDDDSVADTDTETDTDGSNEEDESEEELEEVDEVEDEDLSDSMTELQSLSRRKRAARTMLRRKVSNKKRKKRKQIRNKKNRKLRSKKQKSKLKKKSKGKKNRRVTRSAEERIKTRKSGAKNTRKALKSKRLKMKRKGASKSKNLRKSLRKKAVKSKNMKKSRKQKKNKKGMSNKGKGRKVRKGTKSLKGRRKKNKKQMKKGKKKNKKQMKKGKKKNKKQVKKNKKKKQVKKGKKKNKKQMKKGKKKNKKQVKKGKKKNKKRMKKGKKKNKKHMKKGKKKNKKGKKNMKGKKKKNKKKHAKKGKKYKKKRAHKKKVMKIRKKAGKKSSRNGSGNSADLSTIDWPASAYGPQDRYCGFHLNGLGQDLDPNAMTASFDANTISETVMSDDLPFEVNVFTANADDEAAAFPNKAKNPAGFKLNYVQTVGNC